MSALAYLRTASANAPTSAVIALSTIDDPAARKALAEILANWTPDEVAEAVDEWPVVAGPACRITFIEALASAKPALLDDLAALNALMKLDPFTLERALAARLAAESAAAPAPEAQRSSAPQPAPPAKERARPGRQDAGRPQSMPMTPAITQAPRPSRPRRSPGLRWPVSRTARPWRASCNCSATTTRRSVCARPPRSAKSATRASSRS